MAFSKFWLDVFGELMGVGWGLGPSQSLFNLKKALKLSLSYARLRICSLRSFYDYFYAKCHGENENYAHIALYLGSKIALSMINCVWLCCLTYVIVWMSRVKASFKYWSILITNVGKKFSFSHSFFFYVFVLLHWWFLFSLYN